MAIELSRVVAKIGTASITVEVGTPSTRVAARAAAEKTPEAIAASKAAAETAAAATTEEVAEDRPAAAEQIEHVFAFDR